MVDQSKVKKVKIYLIINKQTSMSLVLRTMVDSVGYLGMNKYYEFTLSFNSQTKLFSGKYLTRNLDSRYKKHTLDKKKKITSTKIALNSNIPKNQYIIDTIVKDEISV